MCTMYELVEIFESLQGEGRNTGRPCVFVRFAGCNLACPWCDTSVKARFSLDLAAILAGGEPTIQDGMPELVAALRREGFWIGVETNGTNDAEWLAFVDYVSCSPKAEYADRVALASADEVRIVASSEDVVAFAAEMRRKIAATDYYISPCDRGGKIDFATAKGVLAKLEGFSLSVQLHKILGFR